MLWRASGLLSLDDYLDSSLGMQKSLFPTVLRLKLAEDLDLGRRSEPFDHTNMNLIIRQSSESLFIIISSIAWIVEILSLIVLTPFSLAF